MPAGKLRYDYRQMAELAVKLRNDADLAMYLYKHMKKEAEWLHSVGWSGLAADKWFEDMETILVPKTQELARILDDLGVMIQTLTDIFIVAEQESAAVFKRRPVPVLQVTP